MAARSFLIAAVALGLAIAPHTARAAPVDQDITTVLQQSAADWSRGDLDAFMRCYENSPDTEFLGRSGPIHGYAAIEERYRSAYAGKPHGLGQLAFDKLEIRPLAPDFALATGRFQLARPPQDGGNASGYFTLLFHRGAGGWRIAYDHTS